MSSRPEMNFRVTFLQSAAVDENKQAAKGRL